jgi:hypothetical protein
MKIMIAASFALFLSLSALRAEEGHLHEHTAPHSGTLVVLGEEFAHVELVLDPGAGSLTAYILDGEAENAVRISQKYIDIKIKETTQQEISAEKSGYVIRLEAVSDVLTGETPGDTSELTAQSERLKGVQEFDAVILAIDIKGRTFTNICFRFPDGNE